MVIALIQCSAQRDGSAHSGLLVADAVAAAGHRVHVFFANDGPIIPDYMARGHFCEIVRHRNWLRTDSLPRSLRNIAREWRESKALAQRIATCGASLVYVNTAASYAGALAARRLGLPCIWHLRELFSDVGGELRVPTGLKAWVRRQFVRLGSQIVVNSRAVALNLVGTQACTATDIPNAIADRSFDAAPLEEVQALRSRLGLSGEGVVIGIPGTLRPVKGHRFALRALEPLLRQQPEYQLVITGGSHDDFGIGLVAQVGSSGIASQVKWTGDLPSLDVFYGLCDVVVIPSMSESFGRTVVEAMAKGLPIVATRVGGIPEIIEDGEDGVLTEYGDDQGLCNAVERLLADPALRQRLGSRARAKVRREYREEVHAQRILAVLDRAMSKEK